MAILGLPFQHTFASAVIGGVGKDARYIAEHIADLANERESKAADARRIRAARLIEDR